MASQPRSLKRKSTHVSIKEEHNQSAAQSERAPVSKTRSTESRHAKKTRTSQEKYDLGLDSKRAIRPEECKAEGECPPQKQKTDGLVVPPYSQISSDDEDSLKAYLEASHSADLASSAILELDRQLKEEQDDVQQFNEELKCEQLNHEAELSSTSEESNAKGETVLDRESSCTVEVTHIEEERRRQYMSKHADIVEQAHNLIIKKERLTRQVEDIDAKRKHLKDEIKALQSSLEDLREDSEDAASEYWYRHMYQTE